MATEVLVKPHTFGGCQSRYYLGFCPKIPLPNTVIAQLLKINKPLTHSPKVEGLAGLVVLSERFSQRSRKLLFSSSNIFYNDYFILR
jgi:hypothetical protein